MPIQTWQSKGKTCIKSCQIYNKDYKEEIKVVKEHIIGRQIYISQVKLGSAIVTK